jgi:hypothetical protein
MLSKQEIMDCLWQYSQFYYRKIYECEEFYNEGKGYSALMLLFVTFENIIKSVVCDYNSNFKGVAKKLKNRGIINDAEYKFINIDKYCIRKIRNLFAHANLGSINLVNNEKGRAILYPITEDDSCILLYEKIAYVVFLLIMKVISVSLIEGVKQKYEIDASDIIDSIDIQIRVLTVEEMLKLKGLSNDYLEVMNDMPKEHAIRILENTTSVDVYTHILSFLKE